jgi:hypothetical protein
MTRDLLRNTAIAHALVAMISAHPAGDDEGVVHAGFDAVVDALGEGVEKAAQAEADQQVELLTAMRAQAATVFGAADDEDRARAGEALVRSFDAFARTMPGYRASASAPEVMPAPQAS